MTLTHYPQLKAYWFNPAKVKIRMRLRNFQDFGAEYHRNDILNKLKQARAKLEHSN